MAKTASENNHGDEENDRIPISILAQATSDSEWHPTTKETALLPPEAMFGDDYVSSHGAPSDEERAAGGSPLLISLSSDSFCISTLYSVYPPSSGMESK